MSQDNAPNFRKIPKNESCWNCDYYSYDGGKCENHNLNLEDYEGYIWDYVCDDWKKPHTIKTIVLFTPIRNGRDDAPDLREIYPLRTCDNCDYNLVCYDIVYKFKNRCTKYDFIVINGDRFVCNDWEEGEI